MKVEIREREGKRKWKDKGERREESWGGKKWERRGSEWKRRGTEGEDRGRGGKWRKNGKRRKREGRNNEKKREREGGEKII